jgi:hypothetical protein
LIEFASPPAAKQTLIRQRDLEDLLKLTNEMRAASRRWRKKRDELQEKIDAGAAIEPGVHTARLEIRIRRGDLVPVESKTLKVS